MSTHNLFGQSYAATRTESDILSKAPVKVQLGGVEYDVKPLTLKKNAKWRLVLAKTIEEVNASLTPQMEDMNAFMAGFMAAFFEFPERVLALVKAYAPDLDWEAIEDEDTGATDEEIVVAYSRIMTVAYPFFGMLGQMKVMAAAASAHSNRL